MPHHFSSVATTITQGLWQIVTALMACFVLGAHAAEELRPQRAADAAENPIELTPFKVTGDPFEEFGLRVSPSFDPWRSRTAGGRIYVPVVDAVLPHTAASKAGVRPGDRLLASDGEPTLSDRSSLTKWRGIQKHKWDEIAAGKSDITWVLLVETAGTEETRTVKLQLPTRGPRWGTTLWRAPPERSPVVVPEPGPLSERAEQILNNGVWTMLRGSYVRGLKLPTNAERPCFLCYQWTLWSGSTGHRMYVSRQRGRTDIIFEVIFKDNGTILGGKTPVTVPDKSLASATTAQAIDACAYLTSPSGELERAWRLPRSNKQQEIHLEAARAGFEVEIDFWLRHVGKVSPLWPLGVIEAEGRNDATAKVR